MELQDKDKAGRFIIKHSDLSVDTEYHIFKKLEKMPNDKKALQKFVGYWLQKTPEFVKQEWDK